MQDLMYKAASNGWPRYAIVAEVLHCIGGFETKELVMMSRTKYDSRTEEITAPDVDYIEGTSNRLESLPHLEYIRDCLWDEHMPGLNRDQIQVELDYFESREIRIMVATLDKCRELFGGYNAILQEQTDS